MKITIVSGSPRVESITRRVAIHLENKLKSETTHSVSLVDLRETAPAFIQKVWQSADDAPEDLRATAATIFDADAYIVVSPEYNGGYSPALKNFFDHFPKRARKPFGIVTASDGAMGGMRAAQQLLLLVPALFGIASPRMLIVPAVDQKFNENGHLEDAGFRKSVDVFVSEFLWLAESLTPQR